MKIEINFKFRKIGRTLAVLLVFMFFGMCVEKWATNHPTATPTAAPPTANFVLVSG